jgi:hypothetical protein
MNYDDYQEQNILSSVQTKRTLKKLSESCIMEGLRSMTDICVLVLDARITAFYSIVRESILSNKPLWEEIELNSRKFVLTEHGRTFVDRLFTGNMASLDIRGISGGNFGPIFSRLILEENHNLCDKALDVLRHHNSKLYLSCKRVHQ